MDSQASHGRSWRSRSEVSTPEQPSYLDGPRARHSIGEARRCVACEYYELEIANTSLQGTKLRRIVDRHRRHVKTYRFRTVRGASEKGLRRGPGDGDHSIPVQSIDPIPERGASESRTAVRQDALEMDLIVQDELV